MPNKFQISNIQFPNPRRLLLSLSVIVLLAAGCGKLNPAPQSNPPQQQNQEQSQNQPVTSAVPKAPTITVYQTVEGSNLNQPSYTIPDGEKAIDLLKTSHSMEVKSYSFGDMVTGIDGIKPDSARFWAFYVNGKSSNVGASDYTLKNGDKIEWKLSKINSSGQ